LEIAMTRRNTDLRYGTVAMTFHWLIAALILSNVPLGYYFNEMLAEENPARKTFGLIHVGIGVTVLLLSLARLRWRNPVPQLPSDVSRTEQRVARGTHHLLYTLMIVVPILGLSTIVVPKELARQLVGPTHEWLAYSLFVLALGHMAAAVFYHYIIRRDKILQRMLPGTEIGGDIDAITRARRAPAR
jgi:cytochrome b561